MQLLVRTTRIRKHSQTLYQKLLVGHFVSAVQQPQHNDGAQSLDSFVASLNSDALPNRASMFALHSCRSCAISRICSAVSASEAKFDAALCAADDSAYICCE